MKVQSMCDTVIEMKMDPVDLQKICRTDCGVDDTDDNASVGVKTCVMITLLELWYLIKIYYRLYRLQECL